MRPPLLLAVALGTALAGGGGCGQECEPGQTVSCYPGPPETLNVGTCHAGTRTCGRSGALGDCEGATLPRPELCDGQDNNCDGLIDEGVANDCGGCSLLGQVPGTSCGVCGQWACQGPEAVVCQDPGPAHCGT